VAKSAIDSSNPFGLKHDPEQREAVVSPKQSLMIG
jgi:hypothetical protein